MRTPTETLMEEYYHKNGYVRLRIMFQVKGVGKEGYQGIRGEAITIPLKDPGTLWLVIKAIKKFIGRYGSL